MVSWSQVCVDAVMDLGRRNEKRSVQLLEGGLSKVFILA